MSTELSITPVNQALTSEEFRKVRASLNEFVHKELKETKTGDNGDYGVIPYTQKKSLLKPGAEKLCTLFGLRVDYEKIAEIEDWDNKFVFYKYRCTISNFATGKKICDAVRSCNNKEKKHASKSVYDVANTVEAVAQKRALVAAVVHATNASDIFDAEMSENEVEAPNKSVTAEEDPRRNSIMNRLYGTATEHGLTNEWIHVAIKKKFTVDSLTELSNEQMTELTELIITIYMPVQKGEKPVMRIKPAVKPEETERIQEAEIVEEPKYYCQGKDHDPKKRPVTTVQNPWCSQECKSTYWKPRDSEEFNKQERFQEFLEQRKNKSQVTI